MDHENWVEAENFPTPIDAQVAKAHLEAHGIAAAVFDAELAGSWVYTNALGGVRLMVAPGDLAAARAILAADETFDASDAEMAVTDEEVIPDAAPYCPACHSKEIDVRKEAARGRLRRWLNPGPALRCRACGHDWRG